MRRFHEDEGGAVAIVVGASLVLMLLMASYVLDLGAMRADRTTSQGVADMAAAAAAVGYDPRSGATAQEGCLEALRFVQDNLPGLTSPVGSPGCAAVFPSTYTCDPAVVTTAVYTAGPYTIHISNPVPDDDGVMAQQAIVEDIDGVPCERFSVRIDRDRDFIFPFAGEGSSTSRTAVSRSWFEGRDGEYASLIVLERSGCETLAATGQAVLRVDSLTRIEDGEEVRYPGTITVDTRSDGCGVNKPVVYVNPSGSSQIIADDTIFSYALRMGDPQPQVYDASRVPTQLSPAPVPGPQITRSPVDHLVNCLPDYSGFTAEKWSPYHSYSVGPIDGCVNGTPAYVRSIHTALATLGSPSNSRANAATMDVLRGAGWTVWPDDFTGASAPSCNSAGNATYGPAHLRGPSGDGTRFYINCAQGGQAFRPGGITFQGVRTIVHRNEITMSNDADIYRVVGAPGTGTNIFFQRGGISRSGGTLDWRDVFVYIEDGYVQAAGTGAVTWRAALGAQATGCQDPLPMGAVPNAACFSPVALWSNSRTASAPDINTLGGQAALNLAGSFFTPNATFNLGGQASYSLTEAQFFARKLEASGQGTLTMMPNPDTTIAVPIRGSGLIR